MSTGTDEDSTLPEKNCSKKLHDLGITITTIQNAILKSPAVLRQDIHPDTKLISIHAQDIGEGKGLLSVTASVQLEWNPKQEKLPTSVVVKVPNSKGVDVWANSGDDAMAETFRKLSSILPEVHLAECTLYRMFGGNDDPHFKAPVPIPQIYASVPFGPNMEQGFIIMEDVTETAVNIDLSICFNYEQTMELMKHVACLQAWSLKNDWKCPAFEVGLSDVFAGRQETKDKQWAEFLDWIHQPGNGSHFKPESLSRIGEIKPCSDKIRHVYEQLHKEMGIAEVMVHGDFWANNILNVIDSSGKATKNVKCFVDWQLTHSGSPVEDLARLFSFSVQADVRHKHLNEFLEYYYTCLTSSLGQSPPFTLEDIKSLFNESFQICASMAIPYYPSFFKMMDAGTFISSKDVEKYREKMWLDASLTLDDTLALIEQKKCVK